MLSASSPSRSTSRNAVLSTASALKGWRAVGVFRGARHGGAGMAAAAGTRQCYLTRTPFVCRTVFVKNEQRSNDPYRWHWAVLAVVLAAEVMDLLDATIINIAGPSIRADLGGSSAFL